MPLQVAQDSIELHVRATCIALAYRVALSESELHQEHAVRARREPACAISARISSRPSVAVAEQRGLRLVILHVGRQ